MLYIHKLADLGAKPAEIESVHIIRDAKQKMPYPPRREDIEVYFSRYAVTQQDVAQMQDALAMIPLVLRATEALVSRNDTIYEATNLQRTLQIARSAPAPLKANIEYARDLLAWQPSFVDTLTTLMPLIPRLRTVDERRIADRQIGALFEKMLRNSEFAFAHQDIVHEGTMQSIEGLNEGMSKGYLFHVTLEEELKKLPFDAFKHRIPKKMLDESDQLREMIADVARGVKIAYDVNMRMANSAVALYSFIKWAQQGQAGT